MRAVALCLVLVAGCGHTSSPDSSSTPATPPAPAAPPPVAAGPRAKLFDGKSLEGWSGNSEMWSVVDGAIHGVAEKGGQLIYTTGEYTDFRMILKSRLVSEKNHLGVCFWGDRKPDFGYGECVLVIPPTGGMWDYHPGKKGPPREKLPHADFDPHQWHETEILAHLGTGVIRMAVNGVEVTRYRDEDPTRLRKGPIGLQIHAGASTVEYKDIEIEVNPKDDRLATLTQPDPAPIARDAIKPNANVPGAPPAPAPAPAASAAAPVAPK